MLPRCHPSSRKPLLWVLSLPLVIGLAIATAGGVGEACTVFAVPGPQGLVVGRTLDWDHDLPGLVVVNPRGIGKTVLPWHGSAPDPAAEWAPVLSWTSRFGSLSFTAAGRDFIEGGMNEAGLVVAEASLDSSYPPPDGRPGVSCAQWMQYQLDRFGTVSEVADHLDELRVDGEGWHFLVADDSGACAVIEHTKDGPHIFLSSPGQPCVITNAGYSRALAQLPLDRAFGGTFSIAASDDSYGRFVRCAAMIRDAKPHGATLETARAILDRVATGDTLRRALYEPAARRIHWVTRDNPTWRWLDLADIDFSRYTGCRVLPVDRGWGPVHEASFKPYSETLNRTIARAFLEATGSSANTEATARAIASHPVAGPLAAATRELNGLLQPLPPGSPLSFPDAVFAPFDAELTRATVVGLGEATHGTAEFFELKHRLFRHLVEVHGHRALAYEYGFAASLALDRYVMTGEGSLDALLSKGLWIQANQQVRSLLVWMRQHNRSLPLAQRVHFLGIDSQLDMWHLDVHRELFLTRYPALHEVLLRSFQELESLGRINYRAISAHEYRRIGRVLDRMAALVQENSQSLSPQDRAIARHLIEVLKRSHEFLYSAYQGDNNVRDGHLAANTLWVAHYLGEGIPFSVWAHDSHVGSIPTYYGPRGPGSMGTHLAQELGSAYYRIATAFTRGSFTAVRSDWRGKDTAPMLCHIAADPPTESVNALLERAGPDRYSVALHQIRKATPLYDFLDRRRPFLGVGDFFAGEPGPHYRSPERIVRILETFDAIFYFSHTRGVQPLNPPGSGSSTP